MNLYKIIKISTRFNHLIKPSRFLFCDLRFNSCFCFVVHFKDFFEMAVIFLLFNKLFGIQINLSRTIEVQENQKVIDTGLYGIVRHPMYSATLLLFLSMPIVLGSVYSFLIFLAYPFIIAKRIKAEEEFLEKELSGYSEYKKKVKYRLIPFIW